MRSSKQPNTDDITSTNPNVYDLKKAQINLDKCTRIIKIKAYLLMLFLQFVFELNNNGDPVFSLHPCNHTNLDLKQRVEMMDLTSGNVIKSTTQNRRNLFMILFILHCILKRLVSTNRILQNHSFDISQTSNSPHFFIFHFCQEKIKLDFKQTAVLVRTPITHF